MTVHAYHDPATLQRALTLAQKLWSAADAIDGAEPGRGEAEQRAAELWIGPHADTFGDLFDTERSSAQTTGNQLRAEAEAWARYWLDCTNARTERIHREQVDSWEQANVLPDGTVEEGAPGPPAKGSIWSTPPQPPSFAAPGGGAY